ncbi:MAG: response regulator [Inquilinus sp.]|uniref:response regulator n=1 Tax=Inquilinus sp. TaxID=1932117 RepID=UPI003F3C9FA9
MNPDTDVAISVLVVDDDDAMRQIIVEFLENNDIRARSASDGRTMADAIAAHKPDLIILDLRLGLEDGLDLLRNVRSRSDLPVIITTGHRRDEIDRVVGLELGADDYLTKPFGLRELLARIRVVLRRRNVQPEASQRERQRGRARFGHWLLDRERRRLINPAGIIVDLTKGEYALLLAFVDRPQRILSREHLLKATRIHEDVFDRSIDVQVLRLRRKLEADPRAPRLILTERGGGYIFTLPVVTD